MEPEAKRRSSASYRSISSLRSILEDITQAENDNISFSQLRSLAEALSQAYLAFQFGTDAFVPPAQGLLYEVTNFSILGQLSSVKSSAQLVEGLISAFGDKLRFDDYADFTHDIFRSFKEDGIIYYNCSSLAVLVASAWLFFVEHQPEGAKFQPDDLKGCASLHHVWYLCKDENGADVYLNVTEDEAANRPKVERLSQDFICKNHFLSSSRYGVISNAIGTSLSWRQWIGLLVENFVYVTNCEVLKYNRTTSNQFDRLNELLKALAPFQSSLGLVQSSMWLCTIADCITLPCFDRCRALYSEPAGKLLETVKTMLPSSSGSKHTAVAIGILNKSQEICHFNLAAYIRRVRLQAVSADPPLSDTEVTEMISSLNETCSHLTEESMVSKISSWRLHVRRSQTIAYARLVPLLSASDEAHPALITFWESLKTSITRTDPIEGEKTSILPDTITRIDLGPEDRGFIAEFRHIFGPIFTRFGVFFEIVLQKPENTYVNLLLHSAAIVQFQRPTWAMSDPNLSGSCSDFKIRRQFYVCMTCVQDNPMVEIGPVCETCADNCHRQFRHIVQSIGKRSLMSCHCGTSAYPVPCCIKAEENLPGSIAEIPIQARGNIRAPPTYCFAADANADATEGSCIFGGSDRPEVALDIAEVVKFDPPPSLAQFRHASAQRCYQCIKCENFYHPACLALKSCGKELKKFWGAYAFSLLAELRSINSDTPFECPTCKADSHE